MRTRLRAARTREDELPPTRSQSTPQPITAPATLSLAHLQRTLGNASLQRYLTGERSASPTADVIRRDTAKTAPADSAPAADQPRTIVFLTMTTSDGKPLRGTSRRKGHEGQFELLSVQRSDVGSPQRTRIGRNGEPIEAKTTRGAGETTTTSNEDAEFVMTRALDDFSSTLMQMYAEGKGVKLKMEWVRFDENGRETKQMMIESADGMFTSYQLGSAGTGKDPGPLEVIGLQLRGLSFTLPDVPQPK